MPELDSCKGFTCIFISTAWMSQGFEPTFSTYNSKLVEFYFNSTCICELTLKFVPNLTSGTLKISKVTPNLF